MSKRFISPPIEEKDKLRQPLTNGEEKLLQLMDRTLRPQWEIYIQPHMNGLRPDFVILNPAVGVVVIEVKDWRFATMDYQVSKHGHLGSTILSASRGGNRFNKEKDNPFPKALLYRDEILSLYCPSLGDTPEDAEHIISSLVVFTLENRQSVVEVFQNTLERFNIAESFSEDAQRHDPELRYSDRCLFAGSDDLTDSIFLSVHPLLNAIKMPGMSETIASELRHWLIEPDVSAMQRRPLPLNPKQKSLVLGAPSKLYRKIKGPAGSGKTQVVAARAAQLCLEQKSVLVVTFNITILNYIRDLAVRWPKPGISPVNDYLSTLNFHNFCKRIALASDERQRYSSFWKKHNTDKRPDVSSMDKTQEQSVFETGLARLIKDISNSVPESFRNYDAILVDEGQDFSPVWWNTLRKFLKEGGEMMLVADSTQDIYKKSDQWTEGAMKGCGLSPSWVQLEDSHRIPNDLAKLLDKFPYSSELGKDIDLPKQAEMNMGRCQLHWHQVEAHQFLKASESKILELVTRNEPNPVSVPDIFVAVPSRKKGEQLTERLLEKNINVIHTFGDRKKSSSDYRNNRVQRNQKVFFYKGDARVKMTTIHSLKGLESRILVLCLDQVKSSRDASLIYTGLTRLKRSDEGSHLIVISSVPGLATFGKQWPSYSEETSDDKSPSSRLNPSLPN